MKARLGEVSPSKVSLCKIRFGEVDPGKYAPLRSGRISGCAALHWFQVGAPCRSIWTCD